MATTAEVEQTLLDTINTLAKKSANLSSASVLTSHAEGIKALADAYSVVRQHNPPAPATPRGA